MNAELSSVTPKFPNVWKLYPVLIEILQNMEAPELLNLSLCSKRALKTVSPVCAKLGPELEVDFKFNDTKMVVFNHGLGVQTSSTNASWQHSEEDSFLKTWVSSQSRIQHIIQLFNPTNLTAKLDLDIDPETTERMFAWAKQQENRLNYLKYGGTSEEMVVRFLKTFSKCEVLSLTGNLGQQFRVDFPLESTFLIVNQAHWVTIENIWNFKGEVFGIFQSSLRNEDLNVFLKDWQSGARNVIEGLYLMISFEDFDIPTIVSDIPHVSSPYIRRDDQQETILYEVFNDDETMIASLYCQEMTFSKLIIRFSDSDDRL
ncbi:hypothetical protein B9Z55_025360 [Caenorhabditis nigoni]|uniref:Uncharacterized protein n=1 Tax=Caenorhabditis nigoni TaxID=1611254 RepID=A0A2G5SY28_9PELO|nr:hypothetical protein B9Z55_025360 [Caenorhabditis nigoni]